MSRGAALRPALLLLLALASAPGAAGQAPSERVAFDLLRDSLSTLDDTACLRARQSGLRPAARGHDPSAGLRFALVSLRLAQLGAGAGASDAIDAARRASRDRPDWPWAWYAWGLAESQRAAWQQANRLALGSRVGVGTLERAAERYRQALAADPTFAPAALQLTELTLALRDTALYPRARDALRTAATAPGPPPDVLLGLGRLERAVAALDSAERAFDRYIWDGGDRALGLLELARTRLARGDPDGEGPYYEGAANDDSAAVAGYRTDLEPIAADSDLAAFDRSHGADRAAFLRRFWTDRDLLELRPEGERLREHYRRLFHARRHFALTVSRRFYGAADAYRSGGMELDDRGVIYVRHGEPAERLRPFVYGLMPNESWRFARAEGDLLFHFSAGYDQTSGGDLYDYRLVESVLDLRGAGWAPYDQLLLSRQALSPLYGRMLNWGRYGAQGARDQERGIGAASIAFGTTSDSYELQFARPLAVAADLVAVGRDSAGPVAQLVFAVGDDNLPATALPGGARYPVRVRVVAIDGRGRPFGAHDTTYLFHTARPLGPGEYLIQRLQVPLPPGRWNWRAAIQVGDSAGVVLPHDSVKVAGAGPGLALSDLALGIPEASARWMVAPGDTVLLTPFDLFREGAEVELYYEAAAAEAGGSYRHEIAVYRVRRPNGIPERRPVVALAFEERADGARIHAHRTLKLGRLHPGRYLVEVRLRGPDGATDTRRRLFRIVDAR